MNRHALNEARDALAAYRAERDRRPQLTEALNSVERHADDEWKAAARRAIRHLAETRPTFVVDDLRDLLEAQGVTTPDLRALGALLTTAARDGLISATDQYAPSRRRNRSPSRVWSSGLIAGQLTISETTSTQPGGEVR